MQISDISKQINMDGANFHFYRKCIGSERFEDWKSVITRYSDVMITLKNGESVYINGEFAKEKGKFVYREIDDFAGGYLCIYTITPKKVKKTDKGSYNKKDVLTLFKEFLKTKLDNDGSVYMCGNVDSYVKDFDKLIDDKHTVK